MKLVDPTLPMRGPGHPQAVAALETITIRRSMTCIAARYEFPHDSLRGTCLDLPGHVVETEDARLALFGIRENRCRTARATTRHRGCH